MMSKKRKNIFKKICKNKKFLLIFIGLFVVILIGVGSFFGFRCLYPVWSEVKANSELTDKTTNIVNSYNYKTGERYLEQALNQSKNDEEKAVVYLSKSSLVASDLNVSMTVEQRSATALEYAYKAESLNPTSDTALIIGQLEENSGNLKNATKYYQLYIDRGTNKNNDIDVDNAIKYYTFVIDMLERKINE